MNTWIKTKVGPFKDDGYAYGIMAIGHAYDCDCRPMKGTWNIYIDGSVSDTFKDTLKNLKKYVEQIYVGQRGE